ncbi:4Fe-4S dicluster domain-containing protein [Clostridium thailandense]|uniref:4Fe-4S dicluster domain-containing protein n=1 Tax=Clostridium thailandense TaxID=2794346 RepID=UPI003989972E
MKFKKLSKILKSKSVILGSHKLRKEKFCGSCKLCVKICEEMSIGAIIMKNIGVFNKADIVNDPSRQCIGCMMCVDVCPKNIIRNIDNAGEREIWNKKFKLARCEECGEYYAAEEYIRYVYNRAGIIPDKFICKKCKRKYSAKNTKKYVCKL